MKSAATGLIVLALASVASGQGQAAVHIVRPGETLASIAQQYYGDPRRESVLVAENGLAAQGGAPIVVGLRLTIPWIGYHRVQAGESWSELAEQYYGDTTRIGALMDANNASPGEQPDAGAEIVVPYPLRHVAGQTDSVSKLANQYYGSTRHARRLLRFNGLRGNRLARGQIVLVPVEDLVLSEEGRRLVQERTGVRPAAGEVRALQAEITEQLPTLSDHVREGRYAEAIGLGNRLLGAGDLTGNQMVTIHRELGVAYVSFQRDDLAVQAFREALQHQPDLELDPVQTSPTVMRAFRAAQANQRASQ